MIIPADVPVHHHDTFKKNYNAITHNTHRLMLFACDQKIEHLHHDFYGKNIHPDVANPLHLFTIAANGTIGAMATQLGLINRYGMQFPAVNYIAKLNSKTNLIPQSQRDPINAPLASVDEVMFVKENSNLNIRGVGVTVYLGSEYEHTMLSFAADMIMQAHLHGLVAIVWVYVRGKAVDDDTSITAAAGAAGLANALGADFVKIKPPHGNTQAAMQALNMATTAAGNTQLICSGESKIEPKEFLQQLYNQIHEGGAAGSATGRNIFQQETAQATAMTHAISSIVYDNQTADYAYNLFSKGA